MADILIIEDEDSVRRLLCRALERRGHRVWGAGSAREALEQARLVAFDLVICDVGLPDLPGPAVVRRLAELRPGTRFLLTSGHPPEEIERRGATEEECIAKPFRIGDLVQIVEERLKQV